MLIQEAFEHMKKGGYAIVSSNNVPAKLCRYSESDFSFVYLQGYNYSYKEAWRPLNDGLFDLKLSTWVPLRKTIFDDPLTDIADKIYGLPREEKDVLIKLVDVLYKQHKNRLEKNCKT